MGAHLGIQKYEREIPVIKFYQTDLKINYVIRKEKKEGEILVRKQSNSSIRDELKFEKAALDLSCLGWIKEVKLRRIQNR